MIPGKKYTPEDIVKMAWKRKWLMVIPCVLGAIAMVVYSHKLPDEYRSETTILIVPQQVPEEYVHSTVTSRLEDRLDSISQEIMSRTRLETVITDFGLYSRARRAGLLEDVIEQMRRDIRVDVVKGDAFRVSYVSDDPVTAMKVTERIARLFIDEHLKDREILANGTNQFLNTQLEDARRRLLEHEKKLEEYRRLHAGELPSQLDTNLAAINNTQLQIQALVESINRDRDRLQLVDRMIADLTSPESSSDPSAPQLNPDGTLVTGTTQQQLDAAQAALRSMELRLKPDHPDIQRMKRIVRDLQKKLDSEALEAPLSPNAPGARPTAAEAAKQNRLKALRLESETVNKQVTDKQAEIERLRQQMSLYQSRADAAPGRESELIELTRDYDTLQKMYTSLLAKSEDSKMAASLESRQIGEQFRVLDPARVPERPFSPNRTRLNAMGAFLGLGFGVLIAAFLEYRDTTLKSDDDVLSTLTLPVLAVIPVMMTGRERRHRRKLMWAVGSAAMLAVAAAAAATWYLVWKA